MLGLLAKNKMTVDTNPIFENKNYSLYSIVFWLASLLAIAIFSTLLLSESSQIILGYSSLFIIFVIYFIRLKIPMSSTYQSWLRWSLVFFSLFLGFRYFFWRATETLPFGYGLASSIAGLLLFISEFYNFITFLYGHLINVQPTVRKLHPASPTDLSLPSVDVFIPTYNEDPTVLRPTVIAATQMQYPPNRFKVWILDDGGTEQKLNDPDPAKAQAAKKRARELRAMAEEFGAGYLSRPRNERAKAGNINNALKYTNADLVLILDCDHIPTRDFLINAVPFFLEDDKLFLLQTPHNFVTPDPVERNLRIRKFPAENELFYTVMQPGLDFWGTSFFCGSAAILRRKVLDQLGGISGKTITEDAETSLDAFSLGYHSAYLNKPMISGLQPETYSALIVQRTRWAQGMLQIFLLKNPWLQPNLSFMQRLLYTNFALYWLFPIFRLLLFLAPPAYLIFQLNLCDTTLGQLLAYAGVYYLASIIGTQFYYREVRWPFISQVYETIQSIYLTQGILQVLRHPLSPSFRVTPKGEKLESHFISSLSWPFYGLLVLNIVAIIMGLWRWQINTWAHGAIAFVLFWAVLDLLFLLAALGIFYEKPQLRAEPRMRLYKTVKFTLSDYTYVAKTIDASRLGIGLELPLKSFSEQERAKLKAVLRPEQTVYLAFPDGWYMNAKLQNWQWNESTKLLRLGLFYSFSGIQDERYAVDFAFGDSDQLLKNVKSNHYGKGVLEALGYIALIAFTEGTRHLWYQTQRGIRKLRDLVLRKNNTTNIGESI